jgi:phosphoribosylanthranilate isomerase
MFIKICGLSTEESVAAALRAGADALGFVFAPSVRRVSVARAAQLAQPARGRALCVAVMKQPDAAQVEQVLEQFAPDWLQTDHGDAASLPPPARERLLPVYREHGILPQALPDRLLFEGVVSGAGRTADWAQAGRLAARTALILAGGLNADNVAAAIRAVRPWGVDVSSGVEAAPGLKCDQRISRFVYTARTAFRELSA